MHLHIRSLAFECVVHYDFIVTKIEPLKIFLRSNCCKREKKAKGFYRDKVSYQVYSSKCVDRDYRQKSPKRKGAEIQVIIYLKVYRQVFRTRNRNRDQASRPDLCTSCRIQRGLIEMLQQCFTDDLINKRKSDWHAFTLSCQFIRYTWSLIPLSCNRLAESPSPYFHSNLSVLNFFKRSRIIFVGVKFIMQ